MHIGKVCTIILSNYLYDMNNINFDTIMNESIPNIKVDMLNSQLIEIFDKHAPYKTVKIKRSNKT